MSTISSLVYLSRIEPGPLSLRVPSGLETRLEVSFYNQGGSVYNIDLAAQLELTPRTNGGPSITVPMPAIDVVNGKARAIFPPNALSDRNGYKLNLYGTYNGEPMLLAQGVIDVIETPGTMSVPMDVIDSIDLVFTREEDVSLDVRLWIDAGKNAPYDLTTSNVGAYIYTRQGGSGLAAFTVTPVDANTVTLTLPAATVNGLPDSCWWSLVVADAAGSTTLAEGVVTVTGAIDAPLPVTTDSWDYLTPATFDAPLSGQIVHSDIAQTMLRISPLSQPGTDHTALLDDLEKDDRITIGATTWNVLAVGYNDGGWYEVAITPVVQDAATGVVPVKFEPPT